MRLNRLFGGKSTLLVIATAAIVLTMSVPSAVAAVAPSASHLQQNWSKHPSATPAPLANCVLPANATNDSCYNPGTHLTWTLTLDVCTSSTTTCTGTSQQTISFEYAVALLPPGETYLPGSETSATLTTNVTPTFTSGSCSSVGAPPECTALAVPNDTYLLWNFTTVPSLNGHPQAVFTYGTNLTAPDGSALLDWAVAHYTVATLVENPVVSEEVFVANPILDVQKSCPADVENGGAINYTILLSNSGHQNATGVVMSDPAPAGVTFVGASASLPTLSSSPTLVQWNGTIPANGTVTVLVNATVNTNASNVTNVASYTSAPAAATFVHQNASCTTMVVHPAIAVVKSVNPTLVSDQTPNTIGVEANVTNTGDTTLFNISVVDSLAGALTCPGTALAPGASMNCTGSYTIPQGTSADFSNDTVVANGTDKFHQGVNDSASASVAIVHPAISVEKTVVPVAVSNQTSNTIEVTANVTNTGDTTLYNVSAVDSLAGTLSCPSSTLAAGASMNCTGTYTIPQGTSANFSNDTVVANGSDFAHNNVTASSNASVLIVHPGIFVVKAVSPTMVSNVTANTIDVTATVTNTGDTTLFNVTVVDSLAGTLSCPSSTLAAGASMNCTGTYTIPQGTSADFSNDTVVANGTDAFGNTVSDEASASVLIVHPAIAVEKAVSPTEVSNQTANTIDVTATVTNTGDTTLFNVTVVDSLAGALSCPSSTLAAGVSMNCTGTYTIPQGTSANFSNDTVVANGTDAFNNTVSDEASASVTIDHPGIVVVKEVSPTVVSNLTANTIAIVAVVTNTGDVELFNVTVVDTLGGNLSCPSSTLAAGASMNCTGTYTIPQGTSANFSNDTVVANGTDAFGNTVSDEASASVRIVHPAIDVVKAVDPTLVTNQTANTIGVTATVTNTGDTTLFNVTVVDSLAGTLSCPSTTLAAGASMNCTGSYTIPQGTNESFSNDTVVANGSDLLGDNVSAEDSASVTIVHPAIEVTKAVSPTVVSSSVNNTIDVTVTVLNTGDVTLFNVTVIDSLAGELVCAATTLAPGASTNCTGSYNIPAGTTANFSNDTAIGNGTDTFHHNVTAEDNATVEITHPTEGGVTDTNFCPLPGEQFRIIYNGHAPGAFQLKSTNPGQFYYNVFTTAGLATNGTVTITIPYPFVTTGAMPSQVFLNQPTPACPSSPPSSNVNGEFAITNATFGLSAYSPQNLGSTVTITFRLTGPSIAPGNLLWFAIHLSYGLKGAMFHEVANGTATCPSPPNSGPCAQLVTNPAVVIGNPQTYTFSNSVSGSSTVSSVNAFSPGSADPATVFSVPMPGPAVGLAGSFAAGLGVVALVALLRKTRPPKGEGAPSSGEK